MLIGHASRKISSFLSCICVAALIISPSILFAEIEGSLVEPEAARLAAADYLPKYYPGDWVDVTHLTYYDLDGEPAAYAFLFRRASSEITTVEQLENVMEGADRVRSDIKRQIIATEELKNLTETGRKNEVAKLQKKRREQDGRLYQFDQFATVVTGAKDTSSLILRCYRGLPPTFAERRTLRREVDANNPDKGLKLGRILYLSPMDIRQEVFPEEKEQSRASEKSRSGRLAVSGDDYSVSWKDNQLTRLSTIRERIEQSKAQRQHWLAEISEDKRKQYEEGVEKRQQLNIDRWNEYRTKAATSE